jgi:hypothetical protein
MTPRGAPYSFVLNQDAGRKSDGTSFQTSNTSKTNTLLICGKEGKKEPQESRDNDKNRKGKQN